MIQKLMRLGVYGITADPFHLGHRATIERAMAILRLQAIILVLSASGKHKNKKSVVSYDHRRAMLTLATVGMPGVFISDDNARNPKKSATWQTMQRFKERIGDKAKLSFIMGSDCFAELPAWKAPENILQSGSIAVIERYGHGIAQSHIDALPSILHEKVLYLLGLEDHTAAEVVDTHYQNQAIEPKLIASSAEDSRKPIALLKPAPQDIVIDWERRQAAGKERVFLIGQKKGPAFVLPGDNFKIESASSTNIRNLLMAGHGIDSYVHPDVAKYIDKYHLYRNDTVEDL